MTSDFQLLLRSIQLHCPMGMRNPRIGLGLLLETLERYLAVLSLRLLLDTLERYLAVPSLPLSMALGAGD